MDEPEVVHVSGSHHLVSLTYLSSALRLWSDGELAALLGQARAANSDVGVTGVLLYSGGNFIQTLEGAGDAVDGVFSRVEADPRHRGVFVVRREEVDHRAFAEWSMGFQRVSAATAEGVRGFTDYLRTGRVDGADTRRSAAATFHRVFREHVSETPEWNRPRQAPDG